MFGSSLSNRIPFMVIKNSTTRNFLQVAYLFSLFFKLYPLYYFIACELWMRASDILPRDPAAIIRVFLCLFINNNKDIRTIAAGLRGRMYSGSFAFRNSRTLERGARFSTASFFETRILSPPLPSHQKYQVRKFECPASTTCLTSAMFFHIWLVGTKDGNSW